MRPSNPKPTSLRCAQCANIITLKVDRALICNICTRQYGEQSCFACTIGTHNTYSIARLNVEIDII